MVFHARNQAGMALGAVLVLALAGGAALAQESTNRVAADTAWSVFVEDDPKECWAVSAPRETVNTRGGEPVQVRRGDILLFATYRPGSENAGNLFHRRLPVCARFDRGAYGG